ncbi:MAG: tRNA lysidine(34) synthetase TilS [Clostridia bacterium]|nr:tRNA lysidine(34) synthetase TilS [Clostridia bacterium]
MEEKVFNYITENSLLEKGDTVLVALSGGSDSVALISVLLYLREKLSLTLFAAHVNHNLRGEDSLNDENFVRKLCKDHNIPLFVKSVDIEKISKEKNLGTEECARDERYKFFYEVSKEKGISKIATAHNKNDNAETVLFNLLRGSGLSGLSGIPCKRDNIVRPLLCVSKEEILKYLLEKEQTFVTDKTNFETDYTRNKIRLNVFPLLSEINGGFINNIYRCSQSLKEDEEYLSEISKKELKKIANGKKLSIDGLKNLPLSILNRVILIFYKENFNKSPDFTDIKLIREMVFNGRTSMKLDLSEKISCVRGYDFIEFFEEEKKAVADFCYEISHKVFIEEVSKTVSITKVENINNFVTKNLYDCDKICGMLKARKRKAGDYFTLSMKKSLKKLFIDKKVPREDRESAIVIADEKGVVFVEGFGVSKEYRVDKDSKNIGYIEIEKGNKI